MKRTGIFSAALYLLLTSAVAVHAQTTLRITVTDATSGAEVKGATVSVSRSGGAALRSETDSTGTATFPNLRGGLHRISVQAIGYEEAAAQEMSLEGGTLTDILISIAPAPIGVKPVEAVVTAPPPTVPDLRLNGFYERMKFNNGIFVDQAEIEKRNQRLVSDLIRSKQGVNLRPDVGGEQLIWFRSNELPSLNEGQIIRLCGPSIYVDGIVVHRSDGEKASPIDVFVKTLDLAGIEIYRRPSQVPEQYGGAQSACGVVLLWTRVRS